MSAYFFLISMYFLTKPFYIFPSGLPQPAEAFLICLFILIINSAPIHWRSSILEVRFWAFLFFGYACSVNLVWGFLLNDFSIAFNSLFYIFNGITLFVTIFIVESYGGKAVLAILKVSVLSAIIQVIASFLFNNTDEYGVRSIGFFENPNQLGYWAILCSTIIFITQKRCNINIMISIFPVIGLLYLIYISLSRGALIACIVLFIIHFCFYLKPKLHSAVLVVICSIFIFIIFSEGFLPDVLLSLGHGKYDDLESRGYNLIWENWQYVLFGAGEGGWIYRFNRIRELHSTFGTVIFSYGVFGVITFICIIMKLIRASGLVYTLYLLPAFLYGLGHQGLRFTLFWVVVGLVATIGIADLDNVKHKQEISG